jgi:hypothetical protein
LSIPLAFSLGPLVIGILVLVLGARRLHKALSAPV